MQEFTVVELSLNLHFLEQFDPQAHQSQMQYLIISFQEILEHLGSNKWAFFPFFLLPTQHLIHAILMSNKNIPFSTTDAVQNLPYYINEYLEGFTHALLIS